MKNEEEDRIGDRKGTRNERGGGKRQKRRKQKKRKKRYQGKKNKIG